MSITLDWACASQRGNSPWGILFYHIIYFYEKWIETECGKLSEEYFPFCLHLVGRLETHLNTSTEKIYKNYIKKLV